MRSDAERYFLKNSAKKLLTVTISYPCSTERVDSTEGIPSLCETHLGRPFSFAQSNQGLQSVRGVFLRKAKKLAEVVYCSRSIFKDIATFSACPPYGETGQRRSIAPTSQACTGKATTILLSLKSSIWKESPPTCAGKTHPVGTGNKNRIARNTSDIPQHQPESEKTARSSRCLSSRGKKGKP